MVIVLSAGRKKGIKITKKSLKYILKLITKNIKNNLLTLQKLKNVLLL